MQRVVERFIPLRAFPGHTALIHCSDKRTAVLVLPDLDPPSGSHPVRDDRDFRSRPNRGWPFTQGYLCSTDASLRLHRLDLPPLRAADEYGRRSAVEPLHQNILDSMARLSSYRSCAWRQRLQKLQCHDLAHTTSCAAHSACTNVAALPDAILAVSMAGASMRIYWRMSVQRARDHA